MKIQIPTRAAILTSPQLQVLDKSIFEVLTNSDTIYIDTENIKLVFCAVKDTIMQSALKEFNLA